MVSRSLEPIVFVTEREGHARELAASAVRQGADTVVAWGGDGTVNEVASALAFTATRLAIVPTGSGNGLARGLGLPTEPRRALDVACGSHERTIDVGEADGRLFVNVAGVGLDAEIAHQFATLGRTRRGLLRYAEVTVRQLARYRARRYLLAFDGRSIDTRPLMVAIANGRQYGNGAVIAADAQLDDGRLDLVVVEERPALTALLQVPKLFTGQAAGLPGVEMHRVAEVVITSDAPIRYHVDGEPRTGGVSIRAAVHPQALRVAVPGPGV